jgi:hypothetical protein
MISTEDSDAVLVANLQAHQESDCLDWVVATINVISHKEVVCVWGFAT